MGRTSLVLMLVGTVGLTGIGAAESAQPRDALSAVDASEVSATWLGRVGTDAGPTVALTLRAGAPVVVELLADADGDGTLGPTDRRLAQVWLDGIETVQLDAEPEGAVWMRWRSPGSPNGLVTKVLGPGPSGFLPGHGTAGPDRQVLAVLSTDLGSGPELYIGGVFRFLGGVEANGVVKLTPNGLEPLSGSQGTGVWRTSPGRQGSVLAFGTVTLGGIPQLIVGGDFEIAGGVVVNHVARWDGSEWHALAGPEGVGVMGSGFDTVQAVGSLSGGGSVVYVGGRFSSAGGVPANNIAVWDGTGWSALVTAQNGTDAAVRALEAFDDGSGYAMFVGGGFNAAGGVAGTRGIARWDGASWSSVGGGLAGNVAALAVVEQGGQLTLYAGGSFTQSTSGVPLGFLGRWNGTTWSAASPGGTFSGEVEALTVRDQGGGDSVVCAAELFGPVACRVMTTWGDVVGSSGNPIFIESLALHDDGLELILFGAGYFPASPGQDTSYLSRFSGTEWVPVRSPGAHSEFDLGPLATVWDFQTFDDGSGTKLYAVGAFQRDGLTASVVRWNGSDWQLLPFTGFFATDVVVFQGALWAGGEGGDGVVRWNPAAGGQWEAAAPPVFSVRSMAVYNSELYVGGSSLGAESDTGPSFQRIARWDGSSSGWSGVGSSGDGVDGRVEAFEVFAGELYVGGSFSSTAAGPASNLARWNGSEWNPVQGPSGQGTSSSVEALVATTELGGPALYVGGRFTSAGGIAAERIARWDGTAWSPLGSGVSGPVLALAVADSVCGTKLWVGGEFASAGGSPARNLARWDGADWTPVSGPHREGVEHAVLAVAQPSGDPTVFVGGDLVEAGGLASRGVARYRCADIFSSGFETGNTADWSAVVP